MFQRTALFFILFITVAALGVACISTDASAYYRRGGAVVWHGAGGHAGAVAWRGGPYYGGARWGAAAVGAAAVGAAAAAPYYYNRPACGYYPYPPCY